MGARDLSGALPVEVRTRFERFPATVKGALVLRGADGNPHAVRLESLEVARIPAGPARAVPMRDLRVDVAPAKDLFVPFETPVGDLDPGWYVIRSQVEVDVGTRLENDSRPFAMPWTRGTNRTGVVEIGRTLRVAGRAFVLGRLELKPDRAVLVWSEPGGTADGALPEAVVEGRTLEALPASVAGEGPAAPGAGRERRSAFYPLPRAAGSVSFAVRAGSAPADEPVHVRLG